jgi:hypothetical protein
MNLTSCLFALLILVHAPLRADWSSLPAWAVKAVEEAQTEPAPARADAWVLLDRTEFLYAGGGEVQIRRLRVVKILTENGVGEGVFSLRGLGGRAGQVKKLKGWNVPPEGAPTSVDRDQALLLDPDASDEVSANLDTSVGVPGVMAGSVVAFESRQWVKPTVGPFLHTAVVERHPVLRWELEADSRWYVSAAIKAELVPWNLEAWSHLVELVPGRSLTIRKLPADDGSELGTRGYFESRPMVSAIFWDPAVPAMAEPTWSGLGKWTQGVFAPRAVPTQGVPAFEGAPRARLAALQAWMNLHLAYRVVYLSPDRGWVPDPAATVLRRRAGDCKDLSSFLLGAVEDLGLKGFPALTRIGTGRMRGDGPAHPAAFNHVIAAIALPESLGLPAEIQVEGATYLLVDPTDRTAAFGTLGTQHAEGRILLCLPTGGRWVDIPRKAIPVPRMEVQWTASAEPGGRVVGTLVLRERADAMGLAQTYLQGGRRGLDKVLLPWLSTSPSASLSITGASDPLDAGAGFEVRVAVDLADGWVEQGGACALVPFGLPGSPRAIQRLGKPRSLAIETGMATELQWDARLRLPEGFVPVLAQGTLDTALRNARWTTGATSEGTTLSLRMTRHRGVWEAPRLEEGLKAFDGDRDAYAAFLATCFGFRKP